MDPPPLSPTLWPGWLRLTMAAAIGLACAALMGACERPAGDQAAAEGADTAHSASDAQATIETLTNAEASFQQRLQAIHRARSAAAVEAVPALRDILNDGPAGLVVAAAAALEGLNAPDVTVDVIDAAGRLSRAHRYEQLRELLYILGDLGNSRSRTYLETIAGGHDVPGIRLTAQRILGNRLRE